jgi:hypothetical protein
MTFYCSKLLSENCNKRKTSFDIIFKCTFKGYYYPFKYFFKVSLRCSMFFSFSVSNNYRLVDLQIFIKFLIQRTQMQFFQQMYNFDYVV